MRRNVYWSERLDTDLIEYMNENNFNADFSREVRNLMRDGLKFRDKEILDEKHKNNYPYTLPEPKSSLGDKAPEKPTIDFSDIKTQKKRVDVSELDERLNAI